MKEQIQNNFLSITDLTTLKILINNLQKHGNKYRAQTCGFKVLSLLKAGITGFPITSRYPIHTFKQKDPLKIINMSLDTLKPAFLLRRTTRSGRLYNLPVPITDKHASFMALNWLRKSVLKHNKNELSFYSLFAEEICASLYKEGSSRDFLKAYIDIAVDQKPFDRFIKKKFKKKFKKSRKYFKGLQQEEPKRVINYARRFRKRRVNAHIKRLNIFEERLEKIKFLARRKKRMGKKKYPRKNYADKGRKNKRW